MTSWHGGKGSKTRSTDKQKFDNNYDIIFSKKFLINIKEYGRIVRIGWIFEGDDLIDSVTGLSIGKKIEIDNSFHILLYERVLDSIFNPTYYHDVDKEKLIAYDSNNMRLYEYYDEPGVMSKYRIGHVHPSAINYFSRYKGE